MWIWVLILVLVIGAIGVLVVGRWGTMSEVYDDRPDLTIPGGRPLTAEDIRSVRLTTGLRGYRMDEVDTLLDRIEADLRERDTAQTPEPELPGPEPSESEPSEPGPSEPGPSESDVTEADVSEGGAPAPGTAETKAHDEQPSDR